MLILAASGGIAIAAGLFGIINREKARRLAAILARNSARLDVLSTAERDFRALASLEPKALVVWDDGEPRLAFHSFQPVHGVPSKLPHLLRFGSWLHLEDAAKIAENVSGLQDRGEAFAANASTLDGNVLEIAGAPFGTGTVLRISLFSPPNKELARLIAENKRLKQSTEDREKLLDSLPVPVWLRDPKGALTWVNLAYVAAIGAKDRTETLEKQIELFEKQQRNELIRLGQTKKPDRFRLQTVVNGNVQKYEAIAAPIERGSGGVALDVSPLDTAKGELDRHIAAHKRTLDRVATGVAVFGADKALAYSNGALSRIWGLDSGWIEERPSAREFLDLLRSRRSLPEQTNYRKWRDEKILAWAHGKVLDQLWHCPDGRTIHVVIDCRDDGGITFLFDDVTEKLALERQYHSLIEGQRETLDHLSEGIAVFGADGRLQLFNPAFQSLWNLPDDLVNGLPHYDDIAAACEGFDPRSEFWAALRESVTGLPEEGRDTFSGTFERSDETYLAYAVTPLPDGGTLISFADVTDSKRFEDVLLERNEALEASDRLKSSFFSHVSYELRTPLTSIIGFADLLAEPAIGPLNAKQREYLNDIKASSQVLLNIINDIIDLAVIDAGAMDLKLAPVAVKDIVEAAELGVRERLARAKVHLDVRITEDEGTVMADSNRLIQVLYNLLSNAISFSPEGGTITLTCHHERSGIAISVQDTGLGIPEEEQATMFDRFDTQGKASRHRGAGLGLSLVKSIVELHKGRIDVRSTPAAGTTVTIFLPDRHPALQSAQAIAGRANKEALPAEP